MFKKKSKMQSLIDMIAPRKQNSHKKAVGVGLATAAAVTIAGALASKERNPR
jgi:hypothetical protein